MEKGKEKMQRIKILLVDDELPFLQASKLYLQKMEKGFQVKTASSGLEALNLITKEPFDVIVADYQMPNMTGLELLRRIKQKDLPFIIFTGKGREEIVIQALNLGADFYLQKGGEPKSQFTELINLIKKAVAEQQTDKSLRKSEREKSVILEALTDHVIYYEAPDMQIIWGNKAAIDSSGRSREEVIGGFCYEIWQQRTEPCVECPVIKAFKTGRSHEKELSSPDGRVWNVKGNPVKNVGGEMIGCIEITREITEQKKMENKLKEEAKFFLDLFKKGDNLMFITSLSENGLPGKFLITNDMTHTTFG
ncbi:MAG: response regulator, partial [Candidatus Heimdallarchaeota archaeon]|nr:response regulator [Candidatus Heimdallarchaeota archaeon]